MSGLLACTVRRVRALVCAASVQATHASVIVRVRGECSPRDEASQALRLPTRRVSPCSIAPACQSGVNPCTAISSVDIRYMRV